MRIREAGINTSPTGKWLPRAGWSGKMMKRNGLKVPRHSHCNCHRKTFEHLQNFFRKAAPLIQNAGQNNAFPATCRNALSSTRKTAAFSAETGWCRRIEPATLSDGTVLSSNSFQKTRKNGETSATVAARSNSAITGGEAETQNTATAFPVSQISAGTTFTKSPRPSAKPRNDSIEDEGQQHVNVSSGYGQQPGRKCPGKIRF